MTQTLKIDCKAKVNLEDANVTFTWKIGDDVDTITVRTANGMAKATLVITRLSMEEYHGKTLECHPDNGIGVYNFTRFNISVEHFPPPNITKFRFQPDRKDEIDVEWLPVNVKGYPGASVEEYYIELARDKDGSLIEDRATVKGGNVSLSHVFKVDKCSKSYWVRVKAVNGNQDVSRFSGWMSLEPVTCPIVAAPGMCMPLYVIWYYSSCKATTDHLPYIPCNSLYSAGGSLTECVQLNAGCSLHVHCNIIIMHLWCYCCMQYCIMTLYPLVEEDRLFHNLVL